MKNLLIMAELIQTVSGLVALTAAGHIFQTVLHFGEDA